MIKATNENLMFYQIHPKELFKRFLARVSEFDSNYFQFLSKLKLRILVDRNSLVQYF